MEVLPRILDQGRLIVLFNLSLTNLVAMDTKTVSTGDGLTELQMPHMRVRGFVQEIAMRSGQTLILTGFEELQEETNSNGVGRAQPGILGGLAQNASERKILVILLTPEVLQSPLSPEALMRDN